MVKAIIDINDETNYVLNLIKAKYSLQDKSEAIDKIAEEYAHEKLGQKVKPSYLRKLKRIEKEKTINAGNVDSYFAAMR